MTEQLKSEERADSLIKKGEAVLATHRPNRPGVVGFPTLDSEAFTEWRSQSLSFLMDLLGSDHPYVANFDQSVQKAYRTSAKAGIGILKAVREALHRRTSGASVSPNAWVTSNIRSIIS
jgi:hypothetical protein